MILGNRMRFIVFLLCLTFLAGHEAFALVRVYGIVKNGYGNTVPEAEIFFISPGRPDTTKVVTDDAGMYSVMLEPTSVAVETNNRPERIVLHQNYPNPFNPTTTISFELTEAAHVSLIVYNIVGQALRRLREGELSAGVHYMTWDGRDESGNSLAAGVYLYRLHAGAATVTRRMLLCDGGGYGAGGGMPSAMYRSVDSPAPKPASSGYTVIVRKDGNIPFLAQNFTVPGDVMEYYRVFWFTGYDETRYSHEFFKRCLFYIAGEYHDPHRHDFFIGFNEWGFQDKPNYNYSAFCQDDSFIIPLFGNDKHIVSENGVCTIEKDTATITIKESDFPERVNRTFTIHCYHLGGQFFLFDNARELTFGYVDSTTVTLFE